MIPGYLEALALMDVAVSRARAAVKAAGEPSRRAAAKARYTTLCDIRRELEKTVKYLKNYERMRFVGSKSWDKVADCECIYKNGRYRRQWQLGGHQITAGSAETPGCGGD